ncbi:hypothetical protein QQ045_020045 [Rhodiola kirilowii]
MVNSKIPIVCNRLHQRWRRRQTQPQPQQTQPQSQQSALPSSASEIQTPPSAGNNQSRPSAGKITVQDVTAVLNTGINVYSVYTRHKEKVADKESPVDDYPSPPNSRWRTTTQKIVGFFSGWKMANEMSKCIKAEDGTIEDKESSDQVNVEEEESNDEHCDSDDFDGDLPPCPWL